MIGEHYIVVSLLIYLLAREAFYMYSINRLVNKLMSRNYQEFKYTDQLKSPADKKVDRVQVDTNVPDWGSMAGIG